MSGFSFHASPDGSLGIVFLGGAEVARFDLSGKMKVNNVELAGGLDLSQFGQKQLAANGHQKLPGGLILQWGEITTTAIPNNTVLFPFAFPNACLKVLTGNSESSTNYTSSAYGQSKTGFLTKLQNGSSGAMVPGALTWLSIGF